jgi:hypothetical protein
VLPGEDDCDSFAVVVIVEEIGVDAVSEDALGQGDPVEETVFECSLQSGIGIGGLAADLELILEIVKRELKSQFVVLAVFLFLRQFEDNLGIELLVVFLSCLGGFAVGPESLLVEHVGFEEVFDSEGGLPGIPVSDPEAKPLEVLFGVGVGLDVQLVMPQIFRSHVF